MALVLSHADPVDSPVVTTREGANVMLQGRARIAGSGGGE
jgi:hypothetical protein